jgi:hypothetical protein
MSESLFSVVSISDTNALDAFAAEAHIALRESIVPFEYPKAVRSRKGALEWKNAIVEIDRMNRETLESIAGRAGVYALFVAKASGDWQLKYIGQAKGNGSKQRIRSHVVWRNRFTKSGKFTGSKFDEVQSAVSRKRDIAISFVELAPASLRHYVENYLIDAKQPEWNYHGTTAKQQIRSNSHCLL